MISVCMATYKGEHYVAEQLRSILSQLGEKDEVIVSDDHSPDNTLQVIRDLNDPRIRIGLNPGERGYAKNFENALSQAKGDFIFLSDQDDVWVPGKVEKMMKALEKDALVVSDAAIVDGELNPLIPSHFALYGVKTGFWHNFAQTRYIGACMAFRKELLKKVLPMPKNQRLCAHDYWIMLVGEAYYSVGLVEEPLLLYRRHGGNASTGGVKSTNSLAHKLKVRAYCLGHLLGRKFA